MPRISQLVVYPVKGCRGISLSESAVGMRGLTHDRAFMVIDETTGFLTQRNAPRLALVETTLSDNNALLLRAPGNGQCEVPLHHPERTDGAAARSVVVWRDTVAAEDAGDGAAAWFSEVLGRRCRLMRAGAAFRRPVPRERIPAEHQAALPATDVSFVDAFPVLVISEASLAELNRRLDDALPMDRFRPNVVLAGCEAPHAEDTWKIFRAGGVTFRHAGPCVRCIVPTINQATGIAEGKEPLRTLALYRRAADGQGVVFGQNVFAESGGRLRVGDELTVGVTD